ncbi:NAD(P)/FAD-dependent oxidoreductase [Desulfofundulus sp.]|uniref:NAD(P)/FAD-dependent oxidoreductase n=1 Tax=Desulfofundulus sp. TaxID=2282750 RepID=UPI003C75CD03
MRFVIIGNSAAGVAAVETLRCLGGYQHHITVVSDEPTGAYSRCLLPDLVAGKSTENSIRLRPAEFYRRLGVELLAGVAVVALRPHEKKVVLADGRELAYDRLLVATGASPVLPAVPGVEVEGVCTLRSLRDARRLSALVPQVSGAVVVGGGLVGLKAAWALKQAGLEKVTVVVTSPRLLIRQLDERAAAMVERELVNAGVDFIYNARVKAFIAGPQGRLTGVELEDGRELPAGLAVVGKGVRPNSSLVEEAGGEVGRGVVVDGYMRTSLEDVYAAGDCIQVTDRLTGQKVNSALWTLAFEQGRYAAANMLGVARPYPAPLTRLNSARFGGVDVVSVGNLEGEEVLVQYDPLSRTYRRLVFDGERLAGYILAGKVDGAGVYTALVKSGRPAWSYRHCLLQGQVGSVSLEVLLRDKNDLNPNSFIN